MDIDAIRYFRVARGLAGAQGDLGLRLSILGEEAALERERHYQMNVFLSRLDEDQRRWYLALESQRMGWGADQLLMQITGVDEKTIRRGREELAASLVNRSANPVPVGQVSKKHR